MNCPSGLEKIALIVQSSPGVRFSMPFLEGLHRQVLTHLGFVLRQDSNESSTSLQNDRTPRVHVSYHSLRDSMGRYSSRRALQIMEVAAARLTQRAQRR